MNNCKHTALDGQYSEYIEKHLDTVQQACTEYELCVDSMLMEETALSIIEGAPISFKTICRRIQPLDGWPRPSTSAPPIISTSRPANRTEVVDEDGDAIYEEQRGEDKKCTKQARETIRKDLREHFQESLDEPTSNQSEWSMVKDCLNVKGPEAGLVGVPPFRQFCTLASERKPVVCNKTVDNFVEVFLNNQLQHLRCVCKALPKGGTTLPVAGIVGGVLGGVLFLVLVAILVFCHQRRRRKQNKRKSQTTYSQSMDSWGPPVYIASGSMRGESVYSEIADGPLVGQDGRVLLKGKGSIQTPPALPERYCPYPVGPDGYLTPKTSIQESDSSRKVEGHEQGDSSKGSAHSLLQRDGVSVSQDGPPRTEADVSGGEYLALLPDSPVRLPVAPDPLKSDYFILEPDGQSVQPLLHDQLESATSSSTA